MTSDDRTQFNVLIVGVGEFYSKTLTKFQVDVFFRVLKIYSLQQIQVAIDKLFTTNIFFPQPADFIKILENGDDAIALEAWEKMMLDMSYGILSDDSVTKKAAHAAGGWKKISRTHHDKLPFVKREFLLLYKNYSILRKSDEFLEFDNNSDIASIARSATKSLR